MKWRDVEYRAQYVVQRIVRELKADPGRVWEIMDQEFDREPGTAMTMAEARDLEEIVLADLQAEAPEKNLPEGEQWLTRDQAASMLRIHVNTLDEERRAGRLAYTQRKPGGRVLIARKDIDAYLARGRHLALPEHRSLNTYRKQRARRA